MNKPSVAILGANGQLGQSLQQWHQSHRPQTKDWHFFSSKALDITQPKAVDRLFTEDFTFDFIINCAAYTAVDQAEKEADKARLINTESVRYLAECCQTKGTTLLHISTDFVFDGRSNQPYTEKDSPRPLGVYGQTKYEGEALIEDRLKKHFILRTGWLYSNYGHNFFKTMQRLIREKDQMGIVYDQIGTPTHTMVLCRALTKIIDRQSKAYGVYHVANEGVASWYDFAYEILQSTDASCQLHPILTNEYPTPAQRPAYSVLDKTKFKKEFGEAFPHWKDSLKNNF